MKKKAFLIRAFPGVRFCRQWGASIVMAFALLVLMPACSSTHFQSARYAVATGVPPFRSVMVAGVDQNPEVRQPFENEVVALLGQRGVTATASHTMFSFDQIKGNKQQLAQKLVAAKVESLLFVRVTGKTDFLEGPPLDLGDMDIGAMQEDGYIAFTQPPGGEINTLYQLGTRFFRVSDGAVIWSGVLNETLKDGEDRLYFIRQTARTIVDRLVKDKVIP